MNKLEGRIFDEFNNPEAYSLHGKSGFELEMHYAKIAASIALELANKAYNTGRVDEFYACTNMDIKTFEDFKKEIL